ncbi:unnamed protein product [Scytosiphon promiscuus]
MRAVSALLLASIFLSSTSIGSTLGEETVTHGSVSGEAGERVASENVERFENGAALQAQESEPRARQEGHGSETSTHTQETGSGSGTTSYAAAIAAAATGVEDGACSAADGSSCGAAGNEQQQQLKGKAAVSVETGEQDGIRIEYVGTAEGTLPEIDRPSSSSPPRGGIDDNPTATAAAETEFELLRCDGESYDRDGAEGGLTAKGVWNHLRSKLETSWGQSAQRIAPDTHRTPVEGESDAAVVAAAAAAAAAAGLGQALAVVGAPVSYLFGMLGGVPGWFSDAVFEVDLKAGSADDHLPERLVLVQSRPRILELACSLVTSPIFPPLVDERRGSAAAANAAIPALLPRLVREFCSANAPFPGKVVSRPCRAAALLAAEQASAAQQPQEKQLQQHSEGWVSTIVQASLSAVGLGARAGNGGGGSGGATLGISGGGAGVCECAAGGAGPCTIRAPPGRDPCLYVELGDVTKSARRGVGAATGSTNGSFGAEDVVASSTVELRTYSLETAAATMTTAEQQARGSGWWEGSSGLAGASSVESGGGAVSTAKDNLVGLWSSAERFWRPPSSVSVPVYPAMLVTGVALLFLAQPLSESRVFHYLLSAVFGGAFGAAAMVLRAVKSPQQAFLRLLLFFGITAWLVMSAGVDLIPSPAELLYNVPDVMLAFWIEGFAGVPWAGKAFFAASGLAGVMTTRWHGLLLDDGDNGWLNGQASIRRTLTATGMWLVYHGVSDTDVGMALVLLAMASPDLSHVARRYSMWNNSSKWYRAGNKLSQQEYEAQGNEYTRQALAELREITDEDPSIIRKLKSHSRRKMTAFLQSGEHIVGSAEENGRGGGGCNVQ